MALTLENYLFPYLRISETVVCGAWTLKQVEVKRLRRQANPRSVALIRIMERHLDPKGKVIQTAVVATRTGPDWANEEARRIEVDAFHSAVSFAVLNANADERYRIPWESSLLELATTETAIISVTPATAVHGGAYLLRGGPISNQKIGGATGHMKFPAPEGLISTPTLTLDGPLLDAAFSNAMAATSSEESEANRTEREIHAAIHWYSRAWENSPLHTMTDVLVQLKTSLEALSGSSNSEKGVKVLRTLYVEAALRPGVDELLWEGEDSQYERTDQRGRIRNVPAFDHWFWNFVETRNRIVHDTLDPEMDYVLEGSPFAGNIFRVADRVCRELIRGSLSRRSNVDLLISKSMLRIEALLEEAGVIDVSADGSLPVQPAIEDSDALTAPTE